MIQRMLWTTALVAALASGVGSGRAQAQVTGTNPDYPRGKISGYIFGDVYYNVTGDPNHRYDSSGADSANTNIDGSFSSSGQPKLIGKDLNGVQVRRVYFQHDADLSAKYSTRFRLEMDGKSLTTDGKISVAVKAAYVQMKNAAMRGSFYFGVLGTPIWETSEDFWAYRSIEKTLGDFRGIGGSADLGIQAKGYADDGHKIGYNLMIGNGVGQKAENNRYKKVYFALPLRPNSDWTIEPYADYEWGARNADKATYKLFIGYDQKKFALGTELYDRINHRTTSRNQEPVGISVFGRYKASESVVPFARYDRYQPDTRAANRIDADLYIVGVDCTPYKDVHVMPNIETTQYRAKGTADAPPHHDMQARVTFYVKFAKP
jgi:hypothetical protein